MGVRVCPICGAPLLRVDVLMTAEQDEYGNWKLIEPDQEELDDECTNINTQVRCGNPFCGPAFSPMWPEPIQTDDIKSWFIVNICEPKGYQMQGDEDPLWQEFKDTLAHVPWEGKINDTIVLQ